MFEPPWVAGSLKTNEPGRSSTALSLTTAHRPLSTGLSIHNLQLTLGLPLPFLGFTHVGTSNESIHLGPTYHDPAIKPVRRRKDDDLIEFFLSGKYGSYLER